MRLPLIALFIFFVGSISAQNTTTGYQSKDDDVKQKNLEKGKNYDINIDVNNREAYFIHGEDSLFRKIYSQLSISDEAVQAQLNKIATVSFKVNFDGKVIDVNSIEKIGYGIDEQLIKLLAQEKFEPATQNGIKYRSEVILDVPVKANYLKQIFNK
jgi:hypothetical protein